MRKLSNTSVSAANSSHWVSLIGQSGHTIYVTEIEVVTKGASAGEDITIQLEDYNADILWQSIIGKGAPRGERVVMLFKDGLKFKMDSYARLRVTAGGAGCITIANIAGYMI